MKYVTCSRFEA